MIWTAFILFCFSLAIVIERRDRSDRILSQKPSEIILKLITVELSFNLLYFFVVHSWDLVFSEPFSPSQLYDPREFSFTRRPRGIVTLFGYFLTVLSTFCFAPVAVAKERSVIIDLCLTSWALHFVACSVFSGEFPVSGCWWLGHLVSLPLAVGCSLWVNYRLEILSMPSERARTEWRQSRLVEMGVIPAATTAKSTTTTTTTSSSSKPSPGTAVAEMTTPMPVSAVK